MQLTLRTNHVSCCDWMILVDFYPNQSNSVKRCAHKTRYIILCVFLIDWTLCTHIFGCSFTFFFFLHFMPCAKKIKNVKTFFFSFNLIIFYLFVIAHIYLLFFPFYNYLGVLAAIIPVFGHICALLYDDLEYTLI